MNENDEYDWAVYRAERHHEIRVFRAVGASEGELRLRGGGHADLMIPGGRVH